MDGLLQQQKATELASRSRARFTVRSLGGKLVMSAALTLLLCMLLFVAISWSLVRAFDERQARSDASMHLTSLGQTYQEQSAQHLQNLATEAASAEVSGVLLRRIGARTSLIELLTRDLVRERLSSVALMDENRSLLLLVGENIPDNGLDLSKAGLRGQAGSSLVKQGKIWDLELETPVRNAAGQVVGVLFALQHLDGYFASDLAANGGLHVLLCQGRQLLSSNEHAMIQSLAQTDSAFCEPGAELIVGDGQRYLTFCAMVSAAGQLANSPQLKLVDIEPLDNFNAHWDRVGQMLLGIGIFVVALGVTVYTIITPHFLYSSPAAVAELCRGDGTRAPRSQSARR